MAPLVDNRRVTYLDRVIGTVRDAEQIHEYGGRMGHVAIIPQTVAMTRGVAGEGRGSTVQRIRRTTPTRYR